MAQAWGESAESGLRLRARLGTVLDAVMRQPGGRGDRTGVLLYLHRGLKTADFRDAMNSIDVVPRADVLGVAEARSDERGRESEPGSAGEIGAAGSATYLPE